MLAERTNNMFEVNNSLGKNHGGPKLEKGERLSICGKFAINGGGKWRSLPEEQHTDRPHEFGAIDGFGNPMIVGQMPPKGQQPGGSKAGSPQRTRSPTRSAKFIPEKAPEVKANAMSASQLQARLSKQLGLSR